MPHIYIGQNFSVNFNLAYHFDKLFLYLFNIKLFKTNIPEWAILVK